MRVCPIWCGTQPSAPVLPQRGAVGRRQAGSQINYACNIVDWLVVMHARNFLVTTLGKSAIENSVAFHGVDVPACYSETDRLFQSAADSILMINFFGHVACKS